MKIPRENEGFFCCKIVIFREYRAMQTISSYLQKIQSTLASANATEHSYRPELRDLFSELTVFHVINEPKGSEHGKPDFIFLK